SYSPVRGYGSKLPFRWHSHCSKHTRGFCMRLLRTMLVTGSAALAAGALTMTVASTATTVASSGRSAHTAAAYHTPSVHFLAEARLALIKYLQHHHPHLMVVPHSHIRADVKGVSQLASFNWSGYAKVSKKKNTFTSVSAKWTQPSVTCTAE